MTAAVPPASKSSRYRPYALAGVCALMVLYFGGEWLLDRVLRGPLQAAQAETAKLKKEIQRYEDGLKSLRTAGKQLTRWEQQSLPADPEVARSLYQAWLVELVNDVGLLGPSVNSSEPSNRKGIYYTLGFSVRGRGTLEQLTRFLFAFYQTDLLHQVRSVSITPQQKSDELDLALSIEALALSGGAQKDQSQQAVFEEFRRRTWRLSDRLAYDSLEAYEIVVRRNLFSMGGGSDLAENTLLTSINTVDGQPEVWFTIRARDEVVKLRVGQKLDLGSLVLTLVEVNGADALVAVDGEPWLLSLGDKITDAHALPPTLGLKAKTEKE